MGCFLNCFCSSNHHNRKSIVPSQPHTQEPAQSSNIQQIRKPLSKSIASDDEHQKPDCCGKKKVTFDLIVKSCDNLPTNNVVETIGSHSETKRESPNKSDLVAPTRLPHPLTHIGNAYEVTNFDDDSSKSVGDGGGGDWQASFVLEESSESLFSLSIDSRKQVYGGETGDKEVNSPMPVCDSPELNPQVSSDRVHSVLTPVQNLSQHKSTKTRVATPGSSKHSQDKENVVTNFEFSANKPKTNHEKKAFGNPDCNTETSLSNWLVSKTNPTEVVNSERSYGDEVKAGSMSIEEEIELSAWSESDDIKIGTVGSYWNHTGQSLDSDIAKEEKLKWKCDPFEASLEEEKSSHIL